MKQFFLAKSLRAASLFALVAAALPASASAQITIGGALSDNTTGPLVAGVVYVASGNISVPAGQTLTIQPGAIVKFSFGTNLSVAGRLLANGSSSNPIIFTDLRDDSVGGDTNLDGAASAPSPGGFLGGLRLSDLNSGSVISGVSVRYGGRNGSAFALLNTSATLVDCSAVDSNGNGYDLFGVSEPVLTRCSSIRSGSVAFNRVPFTALPGFSGLSAVGGALDFLQVSSPSIASGVNLTIGPENLLAGVAVMGGSLTIPTGARVVVNGGTILKWGFASRCNVDGELDLNGSPTLPVTFTETRDDSVGGDTNGDGSASVPDRAWWGGVLLRDGADNSELTYAEIRYAGRNGAALELTGSTATITNCTITETNGSGLDLNVSSRPTIRGLTVNGFGSFAVDAASIQALGGFSDLDFSGGPSAYVNVTSATVSAGETVAFGPANGHLGAVVFSTAIVVEPAGWLEVEAGTVCKMAFATRAQIDGVLVSNGTGAAPVIFTELRDDSVGGDSNGDAGASQPGIAYWAGLLFSTTADGSRMDHTQVRYAGRNGAGISVANAAMTMHRCTVSDCSGFGIDLEESTEPCVLERPRVERSGGSSAISGVRLDRVSDIERPILIDNVRNTIEVTEGEIAQDTNLDVQNLWNNALYINDNVLIPQGTALFLGPGVVMKMGFARRFDVDGSLSVRSSFDQSVYLTEIRDDTVGGDTDGAVGTPSRGYWNGIVLRSPSDTSLLLGLEVRYAGRAGYGIDVATNRAVLREVSVFESAGDGIRLLDHPITLEQVAVWGCTGDGLELSGGSFDVRQATVVACGGVGVRAQAAFTGRVSDSIIRSNAQGDANGLAVARLTYSNVDSFLGTGSISSDPGFRDAPAGDYRLTAGSPCINAGDPASDLDPDSTRADMGAYFFNFCAPSVICTQPTTFAPCAPQLSVEGFASLTSPAPCVIRLSGAPTQSFALFFLGVGAPTTTGAPFGDICVAAPYVRSGAFSSGGSFMDGSCAGRFSFDINNFLQSSAGAGVAVGDNVIGHFWYRYPTSAQGAVFSDGIQLPVCP